MKTFDINNSSISTEYSEVGIDYELIGKNGVRCYLEYQDGSKRLIPYVFGLSDNNAICWDNIYNTSINARRVLNTAIIDKASLMAVNIGGKYENDYQYYCYYIQGGRWGCMNKKGTIQIPFYYDEPIYFENPNLAVAVLKGRKILIDKFGSAVNHNYQQICCFYGDYLLAKVNDKYGVVDSKFNEVVQFEFDDIKIIPRYEKVFFEGKSRFVKTNPKYAILFIDAKCGLIDLNSKIQIIPIGFDDIIVHGDGLFNESFSVGIESKYGMISYSGEVIIPIEFQYTNPWKSKSWEHQFLVNRYGKFGVVNYDLRTSIGISDIPWSIEVPCEYDEVYDCKGRVCNSRNALSFHTAKHIYFVKRVFDSIIVDCYDNQDCIYNSIYLKKLIKISTKHTSSDKLVSYILKNEIKNR